MATLTGARQGQAIWRDYLELTKPKVVVLMLITSLVGMFLATRAGVPWTVLVRKTHHGGDAGKARHFVAAQWLVKNLVHGSAS